MAKLIVDQSSLQAAVKKITKKWADKAQKNKSSYEVEGTKHMQNAIRTLRVYDKGLVDRESKMRQERVGNGIEWNFETIGLEYPQFPRNGLGSSRQYGPRKYDVRAAAQMLRKNGLLENTRENTGRPRPPKPRDINIPPLNNI